MTRLSGSYDLGRFSGACAATGARLEPGAPCITALYEAADVEQANAGTPFGLFLRRLDFSIDGWRAAQEGAASPAVQGELLYYWRTVAPSSEARRSILVDDEVLLDIFHRLEADERPQRVAFRFVLGLFLIRRKLLRVVGQRREMVAGVADVDASHQSAVDATHRAPDRGSDRPSEREVWLVQVRGTDSSAPPIAMVNPHLREEDVCEIAEQLGDVMQGGMA